jgi:DNA-binding NarL/FixJ family response regulator
MEQAVERGALRVYLVEDSQPVRERLEAMLATIEGAQSVGHAAGADEAIRAILAEQPDAVLCDVQLAQGSGFDVLRAVRAAAPEIELYVLTNFTSEPYRRLAARLGAREFFDKSTELGRLRTLLAARAAKSTH